MVQSELPPRRVRVYHESLALGRPCEVERELRCHPRSNPRIGQAACRMRGLPWAWPGLNKLTGGVHRREMTILAARPSLGKTSILVQQTKTLADYLDTPEGIAKYPGQVLKFALLESSAEVFQ